MPPHNHSSRKHRSIRTIDLLLRSALYLMDTGGLTACTVPLVAAEARISQGRIFRRYDSNDAFLSAIFLRYLDQTFTTSPEELRASLLRPLLEETAERVVSQILRPYQAHPEVHRAMQQFHDTHPKSEFALQAPARIEEYMRNLAAVLVHHRDLIAHPDPGHAAMIAVCQTAGILEDTFLAPESGWEKAMPRSIRILIAERARAMVAYLRGMPEAGPPIS